jgi:hypothetical protein
VVGLEDFQVELFQEESVEKNHHEFEEARKTLFSCLEETPEEEEERCDFDEKEGNVS